MAHADNDHACICVRGEFGVGIISYDSRNRPAGTHQPPAWDVSRQLIDKMKFIGSTLDESVPIHPDHLDSLYHRAIVKSGTLGVSYRTHDLRRSRPRIDTLSF